MNLVRDAISALWTLLGAQGWRLEPFQWQYLQSYLLGMFKRLIGSETNRYIHEVLQLLHLATPEMTTYDPRFPDPRVADRMNHILETLGRKMAVIVLPRRSGKSVAVDLAIALTMCYAREDMFVLLMAITLDTARLHLEAVYRLLELMIRLDLVRDVRLSKNDRDVTLVFAREKRKSTFHIIAGKPDVSIIVVFIFLIGVSTYVFYRVTVFPKIRTDSMAFPQPQQQQQQQQPQNFTFDLDTQRADPYKRTFVFTLPKWEGWNVISLQDPCLPLGTLLLIEHCDVTSAGTCGHPYILSHDDGRMVGKRLTYLGNASVPKPPRFPQWAEWSPRVHGLCGLDGFERKTTTGGMEALNEERFFASEWYMTLSELVRSQEDNRSPYKVRRWQQLFEAHVPPILRHKNTIKFTSVMECLKRRYLECPLIKIRSDHVIMDLCIHLSSFIRDEEKDTEAPLQVAVTVSGKRISCVCSPFQFSTKFGRLDEYHKFYLHPSTEGLPFEEIFRRFPISFHRDMIVFR